MGGFRRFVQFVFSLAGLVCLAALGLPWLGLAQPQIEMLSRYRLYHYIIEACLALTFVWLAFSLLQALFARRRRPAISVMDIDGGQITVTKSAVASQASHIVEESGLGRAKGVEVRDAKAGSVDVAVKVVPDESIDITQEAPVLHEALTAGLSAMVGERLGRVSVEFMEAKQARSLVSVEVEPYDEEEWDVDDDYEAEAEAEPSASAGGGLPAPSATVASVVASGGPAAGEADRGAQAPSVDGTGDITIPMRAGREE